MHYFGCKASILPTKEKVSTEENKKMPIQTEHAVVAELLFEKLVVVTIMIIHPHNPNVRFHNLYSTFDYKDMDLHSQWINAVNLSICHMNLLFSFIFLFDDLCNLLPIRLKMK